MSNVDKVNYWCGLIDEQKASGLSSEHWCKERGVSKHSLSGWKTRLNRLSAQQNGWVSVSLPPPDRQPLVIRVGVASIEVTTGFDARLLASVVTALSSTC
jgi:hypothetical protein